MPTHDIPPGTRNLTANLPETEVKELRALADRSGMGIGPYMRWVLGLARENGWVKGEPLQMLNATISAETIEAIVERVAELLRNNLVTAPPRTARDWLAAEDPPKAVRRRGKTGTLAPGQGMRSLGSAPDAPSRRKHAEGES